MTDFSRDVDNGMCAPIADSPGSIDDKWMPTSPTNKPRILMPYASFRVLDDADTRLSSQLERTQTVLTNKPAHPR